MHESSLVISYATLWLIFKWSGLVLFLSSAFALLVGDTPGYQGPRWVNVMRYITWPLLLIWLTVIVARGLYM